MNDKIEDLDRVIGLRVRATSLGDDIKFLAEKFLGAGFAQGPADWRNAELIRAIGGPNESGLTYTLTDPPRLRSRRATASGPSCGSWTSSGKERTA
jgi:hypothetical protein